jgi:hypothetical protein
MKLIQPCFQQNILPTIRDILERRFFAFQTISRRSGRGLLLGLAFALFPHQL